MIATLRCLLRGHHDPKRYPLGGFVCRGCNFAGADLEDMGYLGAGWVAPLRKVFSREHHEVSRTRDWEPTRRGW